MIDCVNIEQQCYQEINDLKDDKGIVKPHKKKVKVDNNYYANWPQLKIIIASGYSSRG